mmetsp:Transcript_3046/g.11711  ORF Transcript_3046/g.11711 Transcript_3046/m.11711 type:complete len:112 (-) Transcript_3046:2263-2598(-)
MATDLHVTFLLQESMKQSRHFELFTPETFFPRSAQPDLYIHSVHQQESALHQPYIFVKCSRLLALLSHFSSPFSSRFSKNFFLLSWRFRRFSFSSCSFQQSLSILMYSTTG